MTFDYAHAWVKLARPAWLEVSAIPEVSQLFDIVKARPDLHQDAALNVPIPSSEFEEIAEKLNTLTLAKAAHSCYFFGHWAPGSGSLLTPGHGECWKLANILDQIISKRLGMRGPHEAEGGGLSFRCIEGVIRAQFSTPNCWTWHEISYASEWLWKQLPTSSKWDRSPLSESKKQRNAREDARLENFEQTCKAFQNDMRGSLPSRWAQLLDTEPFMVEESNILHLETVTPDGKRRGRLCGISADLPTCLEVINARIVPPTKLDESLNTPQGNALANRPTEPGTVRILGRYPEGKSYKGKLETVYADIFGETATTDEALTRASAYELQGEIRKAEATIAERSEALAALRVL